MHKYLLAMAAIIILLPSAAFGSSRLNLYARIIYGYLANINGVTSTTTENNSANIDGRCLLSA